MPDPEADYTIDIDWREARDERGAYQPDDPVPVRPVAAIADRDDRDLATIQAAAVRGDARAEGVTGTVVESGDKVEFMGRSFRIASRIGLMPLLKFASAANMDVSDPQALAAMYTMLRDCIHEGTPACGECAECAAGDETSCKLFDRGDWAAFEEHAMVTKAEAEDLFEVVSKVLEIVSGRPSKPRAGSSPGQRTTRDGSTGRGSATRRKASRR